MDSKASALSLKAFYKSANSLLRRKIRTIQDIKRFYIGVNNLAGQITSNPTFEHGIGSSRYDDNPNLLKTVVYILAYGEVAGRSKLLARESIRAIGLAAFIRKNTQMRGGVRVIQKEATIYFKEFIKRDGEYTSEDREKHDQMYQMLKELHAQQILKPLTPKRKPIVNLIIPEPVQWEKVVLKLKEGLMDVEIWYDGKHVKTASYIELGFSANEKNHKPNKRWILLGILGALQNEDIRQATPSNLLPMLARDSGHAIKIATVHQTKKLLSVNLMDAFETKDNPFTNNKKYYEPRFKILPESIMRTKELWESRGGKYNDNIGSIEDGDND